MGASGKSTPARADDTSGRFGHGRFPDFGFQPLEGAFPDFNEWQIAHKSSRHSSGAVPDLHRHSLLSTPSGRHRNVGIANLSRDKSAVKHKQGVFPSPLDLLARISVMLYI